MEVIDELYAAVVDGVPPVHDGVWGLATMEVCFAILQSAREGRDVTVVSSPLKKRFPKICSRLSFPGIACWTWKNGNRAVGSMAGFGIVHRQTERPKVGR
jgi:hypothetical protein